MPSGAQVGLGVKTAAIYRINEQGNLQQTSNTLDMAIQGNGYFQVTLPSGDTAYTRDGTFGLAADGTIVTADGYIGAARPADPVERHRRDGERRRARCR